MKNLMCILIICLAGATVQANHTIPEMGFVSAFSGLKFRATPGADGQVLKVIPFGEAVDIIETSEVKDRVEWLEGHWILVEYQGLQGYVFDGFISTLPLPYEDFELTQEDEDLTYPLIAYVQNQFSQVETPDTTTKHNTQSVLRKFNALSMKTEESSSHLRVELEFSDIKLKDAYNLLRSMMLTKKERIQFENNTLFIKNRDGIIDRIKVGVNSPVEIKRLNNGHIKINVIAFYEGC